MTVEFRLFSQSQSFGQSILTPLGNAKTSGSLSYDFLVCPCLPGALLIICQLLYTT